MTLPAAAAQALAVQISIDIWQRRRPGCGKLLLRSGTGGRNGLKGCYYRRDKRLDGHPTVT